MEQRKRVLNERIDKVMHRYHFAQDDYEVKYLEGLLIPPSIEKCGKKIVIRIPVSFLIKTADVYSVEGFSCLKSLFCRIKESNVAISVFLDFLQDPIQSEHAKTFLLAHEFAHFINGDLLSPSKSIVESYEREKRADLTAAKISGLETGGIYLFNFLARYRHYCSTTHPSDLERVKYLEKHYRMARQIVIPNVI